jgi:putative peptidoglycan lipid II flippase
MKDPDSEPQIEDERRVRDRLYGKPRLDRGPVDVAPQEEPGVEALTVARESREARTGRLARSTVFFSFATGLSRVAGLAREIVAASYFGVRGPMANAFTVAFAVPNLVRSLFADAALQPAFVPVFTELLERGQRREAMRLASTLIYLIVLVLGLVTAVFVLFAGQIMPLFAPGFNEVTQDLMVGLSRTLFPILILLGVSGIVVGVLNSYDRFGAFAISPLFWNLTIIGVLVALEPALSGNDRIYAYAIGILIGTAVQLAIPATDLRNTPFRLVRAFDWRSSRVRRVLVLMLPVSLSLGLINFNVIVNSIFGSLAEPEAGPAAIDKAFRIYQLPQGIFSVAIATVLFPTLARLAARGDYTDLRATMASGMRQIQLVLIPAAAAILVLAEPMVRLVYQRGAFDASQTELVDTALFWFAFSLPFNGLFLILTRTFFSLQRPWVPTAIAGANLAITAGAAAALYSPFGIGGVVAATAIATAISVAAETLILRRQLGRLELGRLVWTTARVVLASAALAGVSYGVWRVLDEALGRGLAGQIASLAVGLGAGLAVYVAAILLLRIPEGRQLWALLRRRGL